GVTPHCDNLDMPVHQAFRFELDPSSTTRSALSSHAGASRFAYNWGLALLKDRLEVRQALEVLAMRQGAGAGEARTWAAETAGPVPWTLYSLRKEWNRSRADVAPWWEENSKEAYNSGFDALARALKGYFDSRGGARAGKPMGFPTFKKKGGQRSCRFSTGVIRVVDDRHVQLPRLGVIRTKEHTTALLDQVVADMARALSATIKEEAGRWFVSFGCEVERHDSVATYPDAIVGVDLGSTTLPPCPLVSWSRTPNPSLTTPEGWLGSTGSSPDARRARSAGPRPKPSCPVVTAGWPMSAATPCTSSQPPWPPPTAPWSSRTWPLRT